MRRILFILRVGKDKGLGNAHTKFQVCTSKSNPNYGEIQFGLITQYGPMVKDALHWHPATLAFDVPQIEFHVPF